ncbi:outer membrane beta-barrel protein [Aestuariibaculum sediminum]|uniref:Porin family protein n=1 Tax=Aestuariibaculum sediminum TaxID=2770637 RepID=A0A8J6Q2K9_9FLAO|nr:outer membrane beta-barrel protein [Aestuariibaculum sediminum]MBD0832264.1 porin family protein [Aestuariibaculum sediminum]
MKNLFFTIICALIISLNTNAQDSNFGIKGGYNLAAVSYDNDYETGQRHGFHIGIYGESGINENLALQVEFLYSQQGYQLENSNATFTQKLDYLNLPLLLKLYPTNNFYLEAGPQAGLAISHKEEYEGSFFNATQEIDPDNFDWGINLGGGFKTDSGVSLGVRYHLGMGDIYDDGNPKNRVWQFSVGFDF